jgi:hypothetical protein
LRMLLSFLNTLAQILWKSSFLSYFTVHKISITFSGTCLFMTCWNILMTSQTEHMVFKQFQDEWQT